MTQDPQSKKYRLGYGSIDLGRRAASSLPVRQAADPIMRRLAEKTGETVVLTVVNDARDRAVCIERIESRHDLRLHLEVGEQSPLHAGASSKVLLAYFRPDDVDALARRAGLPQLARNTITRLEDLQAELKRHLGDRVPLPEPEPLNQRFQARVIFRRGLKIERSGLAALLLLLGHAKDNIAEAEEW